MWLLCKSNCFFVTNFPFWRVQVRAEEVVEVPSRADAGFAAAPVFGGAALGVVALGLRGEWTGCVGGQPMGTPVGHTGHAIGT